MRILIEEYRYDVAKVKDVLHGIDALENIEGQVSIHYVGYYYNTLLKDCVFILPKVLLENVNGTDKVFGKSPEDIVNLNENTLEPKERDFLYEFAVWIYRAITVYKNQNCYSDIVYHTKIAQIGKGRRRLNNTFLDILLQLLQFNKENQDFFFFIIKNLHAGLNKINWTRTISRKKAIVQDNSPIYLNPINKKRRINFDEELLIIFFSILNYISRKYGFRAEINCQYDLITGKRFETYLKGYGKTRLLQIKYKYFSDKALELWWLCFAFFDEARQISINTEKKEYLLVKNFYIVFEAIIDELVGDNPLPDEMDYKQDDGKIVDHLFTAKSLIENNHSNTYYIGDSKYYKIGHELSDESVYKQYTYARNVIQKNIDIFNTGNTPESGVKLRDDMTEGYNIIPNFFISATMSQGFDYGKDGIGKTTRKKNRHNIFHFKNRLFDRDTLLLFHYDINFLFVLALYARNNASQKAAWKVKIRDRFRSDIQQWLQDVYDFYAMKPRPGVDAKEYFKTHFREILGKTFTPFEEEDIFSLALEKNEKKDNKLLLAQLRKYFFVEKCELGKKPKQVLELATSRNTTLVNIPNKNGVLMVMMENFEQKSKNFLPTGKLAIGIKYTRDTMEIVEHLNTISYILFHHRSAQDKGQHLFKIKEDCTIKSLNEIEDDRYRNPNNEDIKLFIVLDIETQELDASTVHGFNKKYTPETRCDAQYSTLDELLKEP